MRPIVPFLLLAACTEATDAPGSRDDTTTQERVRPVLIDVAMEAGVNDGGRGQLHRGRACVAADFDEDGWVDLFVGNPGDPSFLMRNTSGETGGLSFAPGKVLLDGRLSWGATAADADNDGDIDLFVTNGGNEGYGYDVLLRNLFSDGEEGFSDVSVAAGVQGPRVPDTELRAPMASANAAWADLDRDGDLDLFVNSNWFAVEPQFTARNTLWRNEGDGTFTDITAEVGLDASWRKSRHSTFVDLDGDGDLDLYENNHRGFNVAWVNRLVEDGTVSFAKANEPIAALGADISAPLRSFASAAADVNQDGLEDLIVFTRGADGGECSDPDDVESGEELERVEGHYLFLNLGPEKGFVDVADISGLNQRLAYRSDQPMLGKGVMGCQVEDLDGDGLFEVFIGNGGPFSGERNELYSVAEIRPVQIAGHGEVMVPFFDDWTDLVDTEAPFDPDVASVWPQYPYRTHGTCVADFDRDGLPEMYVTNGGPSAMRDEVREPDRLFDVRLPEGVQRPTVAIRLRGDGVRVPLDPVGARMALTVRDPDGSTRTLYRTVRRGLAFSAQNDPWMMFGLGAAEAIEDLAITWPDGTESAVAPPAIGERVVISLTD